jgi:hypothetical protein
LLTSASDAPERPGRDAGHVRGGLGISDVEGDAEPLPILCLYQLERQRAVVHIGSNDKRSRRRQASREFLTDSARGARDRDDFAADG